MSTVEDNSQPLQSEVQRLKSMAVSIGEELDKQRTPLWKFWERSVEVEVETPQPSVITEQPLEDGVKRLKSMAVAIGEELDKQHTEVLNQPARPWWKFWER